MTTHCTFRRNFALFTIAFALITLPAFAQDQPAQAPKSDPYPLDTCAVAGSRLGAMGKPVVIQHEGREVRFCCGGCVGPFNANPARYLEQVDKKIADQQRPHYPLEVCVISGRELGDNAVERVIGNRLVRFCCEDCPPAYEANRAENQAQLDAAVIEKQKPGYPTDVCIVSGDKLDDHAIDHVIGHRLVRLCCAGCIMELHENPGKHLGKLDNPNPAPKAPAAPAHQHRH